MIKIDEEVQKLINEVKRFDDLNLLDIHFHGQSKKDGSITFICYELQNKDIKRTELIDNDKVLIFAYTEPYRKELNLIVKPKVGLSDDEIAEFAKEAKSKLDKLVSGKNEAGIPFDLKDIILNCAEKIINNANELTDNYDSIEATTQYHEIVYNAKEIIYNLSKIDKP